VTEVSTWGIFTKANKINGGLFITPMESHITAIFLITIDMDMVSKK